MTVQERLRNFARYVVGVLAVVGVTTQVGAIYSLLLSTWASLGSIFTLTTIGALTLPPHVPPETPVDWAVVIVGGLFALKILSKIHENYQETPSEL